MQDGKSLFDSCVYRFRPPLFSEYWQEKTVKNLTLAAFVSSLTFGMEPALASMNTDVGIAIQKIDHGGGCRKSSPPGQCCHMDNSTGIVHCH
ncbi:MAG: hypothetical protein GC184_04810 [Rhizobiales bacterium]|nr:hypothetical protein [Hyphomicrobiales bacterium]